MTQRMLIAAVLAGGVLVSMSRGAASGDEVRQRIAALREQVAAFYEAAEEGDAESAKAAATKARQLWSALPASVRRRIEQKRPGTDRRLRGLANEYRRRARSAENVSTSSASEPADSASGTSEASQETPAIHPGAGGEAKCLPAETMLDLAGQIRKGGRQVVFLFGPIERERWAEAVQDRYRRVGPVLSDLSLPDLAGVLSQAGGFVGMDSGPGHLAGALGTKTLVIFITTHSGNFRPIGPSVDVLSGGAAERFSAIRKILL